MTEQTPWTPDDATLATLDRWLAYRLWHSRTPGAQVAVGRAGRTLFSRAYGYADLATGTPLTTRHLFRIASHSKTFTSTLVLQLAEQGRLSLEDPVGRFVPELADVPELAGLRLRELAEHTAGVLRDGRDADYWQHRRPFPERAELVALVREGGLKSEPGSTFGYSNLGYSLLGLVVEAVTGVDFATAARQGILDPLGLADTDADYPAERAGDYAAGHTGLHTGTRREVLGHVPTGAMAAATGFTSTAEDLVRYFAGHTLGDERLLSDRSKRLQQRLANVADPRESERAGYGWGMVVEHVDDRRLVGHSGGYPGHLTKTLLDPADGLVVSVLTNAIDGPATALARGVVQLLGDAAATAERGPLPASALALTGRYGGPWGVLDLAAVGGRLLLLHPVAWNPLEACDELAVEADGGLRIADGSGYGSVGEPVGVVDAGDDGPARLRFGGMTMAALDALPDSAEFRAGGVAG